MMGRYIAIALLGLTGWFAAAVPGQAYSASQAEALTDPSSADPYTFPNVKPCCAAKPDPCANGRCRALPPRPRPCWERPTGCRASAPRPPRRVYRDREIIIEDERPSRGRRLTIDYRCDGGGETRSLQEAVELAQDGDGIVYVYAGFPGGQCREALRVTGSVTLIGVSDDPSSQRRPDLEPPPGPCITVSGPQASLRLENININSAGGPACIDISRGTVRLDGVNVNAPNALSGVMVRSGRLTVAASSAARSAILGGGPAVFAQASDILIRDTVLETSKAYSYTAAASYAPAGGYPAYAPGYPPVRFFMSDPDAPYAGGGVVSNPWPGSEPSYPPPASYPPPHPVPPQNTWPSSSSSSRGTLTPGPVGPIYPQASPYLPAGAARMIPAPKAFDGTPVLVLEESQALIQRVRIQRGTTGVAAILSSNRTGRDVRIRDTLIDGSRGATGIVAAGSPGWLGQSSRLIIEGATEVRGYDVGLDLLSVGVSITGVTVGADDTGIRADKYAFGQVYGPRVTASGRCFRVDDDGFSGDKPGSLTFYATSCRD
jgi:hypothetical protein